MCDCNGRDKLVRSKKDMKQAKILMLVNDKRDFLISIDEKQQYNFMNVDELIRELEKLKYDVNV